MSRKRGLDLAKIVKGSVKTWPHHKMCFVSLHRITDVHLLSTIMCLFSLSLPLSPWRFVLT